MDGRGQVPRRDAGRRGPRARRRAFLERRRGTAGDQRHAESGQAPAPARPRPAAPARILEIGTLGGYSTIWLARALPAGGRLITLESEPKHADVARANLARAGLAAVVDLRVGPALDDAAPARRRGTRPVRSRLHRRRQAEHTRTTSTGRSKLSRPGSLIIVDNVVRGGAVIDERSDDRAGGGDAAASRDAGRGAARCGHGHPDGWRKRVRRLRGRAGSELKGRG